MMLILGVGGNKFWGVGRRRRTAVETVRVFGGCMPFQHLEDGSQSALWEMMVMRLSKRGFRYVL